TPGSAARSKRGAEIIPDNSLPLRKRSRAKSTTTPPSSPAPGGGCANHNDASDASSVITGGRSNSSSSSSSTGTTSSRSSTGSITTTSSSVSTRTSTNVGSTSTRATSSTPLCSSGRHKSGPLRGPLPRPLEGEPQDPSPPLQENGTLPARSSITGGTVDESVDRTMRRPASLTRQQQQQQQQQQQAREAGQQQRAQEASPAGVEEDQQRQKHLRGKSKRRPGANDAVDMSEVAGVGGESAGVGVEGDDVGGADFGDGGYDFGGASSCDERSDVGDVRAQSEGNDGSEDAEGADSPETGALDGGSGSRTTASREQQPERQSSTRSAPPADDSRSGGGGSSSRSSPVATRGVLPYSGPHVDAEAEGSRGRRRVKRAAATRPVQQPPESQRQRQRTQTAPPRSRGKGRPTSDASGSGVEGAGTSRGEGSGGSSTTREEDLALLHRMHQENEGLLAVRGRLRKEIVTLQDEEDTLRRVLGLPPARAGLAPPAPAPVPHVPEQLVARENSKSKRGNNKRPKAAAQPPPSPPSPPSLPPLPTVPSVPTVPRVASSRGAQPTVP
ncbi:unnamed protein product, partial [Scytosiphon promiscuus]